MIEWNTIEDYKKLISEFDTRNFGKYSKDIFTKARKPLTGEKFGAPTMYPSAGHPRVLFRKSLLDLIRENMTKEENLFAYERYMALSDEPCDGKFAKVSESLKHNMNYELMSCIEAKAFRYAMTGEKLYGYQAIYSIKNAILTIDIPSGTLNDDTRAWGWIMYIAACVYDWCYDLLCEEDKRQIIAGCVMLIGKKMEIVRYISEENYAPIAQGPVYGHGGEAQLLRDWLSFAIACYDEAPEIYELVAGRILNDFVEMQNYFFESENHWEGSSYSCHRTYFSLFASFLIDRMSDEGHHLFSDKMENVVITVLHYIRPDDEALRIGDVWQEGRNDYFTLESQHKLAFLAGNYYRNPYLKSFAYRGLEKFSTFTAGNNCTTAVMYLLFNDTSVSCNDESRLALTRTTKHPFTSVIARSARDDRDAFMLYISANEMYAASHAHMDCGAFQIYYKGSILASGSGKYSSWGKDHHMGYTMQTVSTNSVLVYNPNLADTCNSYRPCMVYSGGQSIAYGRADLPSTMKQLMQKERVEQCTSLGKANVEKDGIYLYSYLGVDMTDAYDEETVDEVARYIVSAKTDNEKCPYAVVVYDRIISKDESYKKSALIHLQKEPVITDEGFAIITNDKKGGTGKLVVQSVVSDTKYTVIGGEGKEFWLHDKNMPTDISNAPGTPAEYGWGRIEISPKSDAFKDHLLTVTYVTDTESDARCIKAEDLSTDKLCGTAIFNTAFFFPKDEKLISSEVEFTLGTSASCFIAGIIVGNWDIMKNGEKVATVSVSEGENLINQKLDAGSYILVPSV